ncbi:MAG: hypothetical protein ABIP51_05425 [Bacteroidia bacterium]
METEQDIDAKIISITNNIRQNHPELLNYLNEMPVTIPNENNPKINSDVLKSYYDSLCSILKTYEEEHNYKK